MKILIIGAKGFIGSHCVEYRSVSLPRPRPAPPYRLCGFDSVSPALSGPATDPGVTPINTYGLRDFSF